MKTIAEIKAMADRDPVDAFEGVIEDVYDAKDPTPGQVKVGIHKQAVKVSQDSGDWLFVDILKKSMHLKKDCEGDTFRFESLPDDNGDKTGLKVNKWTNREGQERTNLIVSGSANMYSLDAKPDTKPEGSPQKKRPVRKQGKGKVSLRDRANHHRACYLAMETAHAGSMLSKKTLASLATHLSIATEREILNHVAEGRELRCEEPPPEEPEPISEATPPKKEAWREVTDKNGKCVSGMGKADLKDMIIKYMPFHNTGKPKIREVLDAVARSRKEMDLPYEEVYDAYQTILQKDYKPEDINFVYDDMAETIKDNEKLCMEILKDQETFTLAVAARQELGTTIVKDEQ